MSDVSKSWLEAEQRIEEARASGAEELDLSGLHIEAVPTSVAGLERVRIVRLHGCVNLVDLTALEQLPALQDLDLCFCYGLSDLSLQASLPTLQSLQSLDLSYCHALSNLSLLTSLPALQSLSLSNCEALNKLSLPVSLPVLQSLKLDFCRNLSDLSLPASLPSLQALDLSHCRALSKLSLPTSLPSLQFLGLSSRVLSELLLPASLPALETLHLYSGTLRNLSLPASLPALQSLNLSECQALRDLSLPASLPALQSLNLRDCHALSNLSLPTSLPALQSLHLIYCHAQSNLSLLASLPTLQSLHLSYCYTQSDLSLSVSLPTLQSLHLECNVLSNLSLPVSQPALRSLHLECHALSNLSLPVSQPALESLHLECRALRNLSLPVSLPALESLYLHSCHALSDLSLPTSLPALQSLHLECYMLSNLSLPTLLPALQSLDLRNCHVLSELPLPTSLPALQSLSLECHALGNLPLPTSLPALQYLRLSDCNALSDLSLSTSLPSLQSLDLSFCRTLSNLSLLTLLPALQSLKLRHCDKLDSLSLPASLPALQSLTLGYCDTLSALSLPASLPALQSLDLSSCEVLCNLSLPVSLPALRSLDLVWFNALSNLSLAVSLPALESLHLHNCHALSYLSLPVSLPALQFLYLSENNSLSKLSLPVSQPTLQSLDLHECQALSDLSLLGSQPALQSLNLNGCNALSDLSALLKLPALRNLKLPDSVALSCQPGSSILDTAAELETLSCYSLLTAPNELASLTLDSLELDSPGEFSDRTNCLPRLKAWRADLDQGQADNHRIKLFVLGNGSAGKTQICRRLNNQVFDPSISSTHGIDLGRVTLIPANEDKPAVIAHVWDFGGQDIYHGTHALFMDERALFVIVWNPELEAAQRYDEHGVAMRHRPLAYWLAMVRDVAGEDAAVVVVQSKCDQLQNSVPPPLPAEHGLHLLRHTECSARQVDGMDSVLAEIRRQARLLLERYGQVLLPASWVAVGDTLRARCSEGLRTLPRAEFETLCRAHHASAPPEVVLYYLHRSGEVFYRQGLFGDQLILDQQWALDGVYAVLDRQRSLPLLRRQGGRFDQEILDVLVWRDKYSSDEQALFISLMRQCGACFPVANDVSGHYKQVRYLAPDLLPERRELQEQIDRVWRRTEAHLEVWLNYRFLHDGVMKELLCAIGRRAGVHAVYWRYGVCFFDQGMQATFLLEAQPDIDPQRPGAGRLVWQVHVAQENKMDEVQRWLNDLLSAVEYKTQGQRPEVSWQRSQAHTPAQDRKASHHDDPIQRLQPGSQPDAKPTVYVSYGWGDANTELLAQLETAFTQHGYQLIYDKRKMRTGDWISAFMREIGQSRHVLVLLDDKYLRSPYCMRELLYLYQSSLGDKAAFCRRIVPLLPTALPLSPVKHRLPYLRHWKEEAKSHQDLLDEFSLAELSPETRDEVLLVKDFCHRTDEMLAWIADIVMDRDAQALSADNFAAIFTALHNQGFPLPAATGSGQ